MRDALLLGTLEKEITASWKKHEAPSRKESPSSFMKKESLVAFSPTGKKRIVRQNGDGKNLLSGRGVEKYRPLLQRKLKT